MQNESHEAYEYKNKSSHNLMNCMSFLITLRMYNNLTGNITHGTHNKNIFSILIPTKKTRIFKDLLTKIVKEHYMLHSNLSHIFYCCQPEILKFVLH